MKWYRNPLFFGCLVSLAIGNEYAVTFLFSQTGDIGAFARWFLRTADVFLLAGAVLSPQIIAVATPRIAEAFRRAPNLCATAVGTILVGTLAVVVELGFYAHNVIDERWHPDPIIERSVPISRIMEPGITCRERRVDGDHVIYDFTYTLDDKSARVTPASPVESTGRDLVFFGCSFTFGVGLEDDETLPNDVALLTPGWRVTNFGGGGYGPAHMLRRLEDGKTAQSFCGNETHVIYTYIPHHVRRAIGAMRAATRFVRDAPYYVVNEDGELEYRGTMTTGRPWLQPFYRFIDHEAILKYYGVDLPFRITDEDFDFTARIIAESRNRWVDAVGDSDFTVVIYPQPLWAETPAEDIIPALRARGIHYLNYSDRFDGQPEMWIPRDKHPTAAAQARVAHWIVADLGLTRGDATTD